MLSLLIFFLMIGALPALCAVASDRKFEETLPLSCAGLALTLYLTALLGLRHMGIAVAICLCLLCLLYALRLLLQKKCSWRAAARRFFTPAFFLYLLLFGYLAVLNYGRMAWEFDALSHWADVVKAMVQTGRLSTDPLAHSTFQSYPPGLSLFQYLSEELEVLLGGEYADWRLYHAFQVFFLAFLLPFLRELDFRKIYAWLLAAAVLLAPTFLFANIYTFIYVDPVLGVVAASGLAMILLEKRRNGPYLCAYVALCAAMLVLIKDAGLAYAIVLAALYLVSQLGPDRQGFGQRLRERKWAALVSVAAVLLPWGSWKLNILMNNAAVAYPDKVPLTALLKVLLFQDQSYRKDVRDLFWTALLENGSSAAISGIGLTYIVLIALLLTAFLFALKRCRRRFPERADLFKWVFWLKLAELALYLLSLLVMYLFKFSAYEALQLASLERYMAVPLLSVWLLTLFLVIALIQSGKGDKSLLAAAVLCAVLIGTPPQSLINLSNRASVAQSRELRAPITALEQRFEEDYSGAPARIYFLSQEDAEYAFYMTKYSFRPHAVSSPLGWSLGEPFYEGDVWTRACTPEQLREKLKAEYDFVVVYRMNDDFARRFGALFSDPDQIGPQRIYAVDRDSGQLTLFGEM